MFVLIQVRLLPFRIFYFTHSGLEYTHMALLKLALTQFLHLVYLRWQFVSAHNRLMPQIIILDNCVDYFTGSLCFDSNTKTDDNHPCRLIK